MDIQETIKLIDDIRKLGTDVFSGDELEALNTAIEILERTRWIPVSERLPGEVDGDKYGTVQWCVLYNGQHRIVWHEHYQWRSKDGVQTHWMPLPKPPQEVE